MEAWNNYTIYNKGFTVKYNGIDYISLQDENFNNLPTDADFWDRNIQKVDLDVSFGLSLIKIFRADNAQYEQDNNVQITVQESLTLMGKFQSLIGLCQVGAIAEAYAILPSIQPDDIFTQERKDKYLGLLQNYLGA